MKEEPGDERHELARRSRRATALSLADFARLLGVAHTTVVAWEQGRRNPARRTRHMLSLVEAEPALCQRVLCEEQGVKLKAAKPSPNKAGERKVEGQVSDRLRRLARGGRRGVPLDLLREELRGVPREAQDQALLALKGRGALRLGPALFPGCMSTVERAAALSHPQRGLLAFAELSEVAL